MNIFRTFWKSIRDLFDELVIIMIANLLWLLINLLPIILIALAYISGSFALFAVAMLLSVITLGPSNAGLYAIAERITEGRTSSWRDFVAGVRAHALLSWKVYGLWMLGLVILLFNGLQFFSLNASQLSAFLSIVYLYLILIWYGALVHIGPLMLLQTDKRIRTIARNAALMTFGRPLFTLGTIVLMAIVFVASAWLALPILLASFAFLALWSFRATLTLIAEAEARRARASEQAANAPAAKGRGGQVRPRE